MAKRMTPEEKARHELRERLIAYYERRKKYGNFTQHDMCKEIPCSISMLSPALTRARPLTRLQALAFERYLERMEA